ncbi:hypothetical protein PTKIN_Ptkin10aG0053800 [Pterospermum kingtungense]
MDRLTANQERLAFANVCVLVDAIKTISREIGVKLRVERIQVGVKFLGFPLSVLSVLNLDILIRCVGNNQKLKGIKQKRMPKVNEKGTGSKEQKLDDGSKHNKRRVGLSPVVKQSEVFGSVNGMQGCKFQGKAGSEARFKRVQFDKGKGILIENVKADESQEKCPIQENLDNNESKDYLSKNEVNLDSNPHLDVQLSKRKPALPIASLTRPQRLAALGATKSVELVKAKIKKCRR